MIRWHGRSLSLVVVAAVTSVPMVVVMASPSWASCGVFASTPTVGVGGVYGHGGRSGCGSIVHVDVKLRWDRPFSTDPTLSERQGQYRNVTLYLSSQCVLGTHDYYVDTNAGGGYATSDPRKTANC